MTPRGGSRCDGVDDTNLDSWRHDRRRMGDVVLVGEDELQGMLTRRELDMRFTLAGAEMEMVEIVWNRLVERRHLDIDQEMVMARILLLRARRRDAHARQGRNG
jgi:hypothetical protein